MGRNMVGFVVRIHMHTFVHFSLDMVHKHQGGKQ